MIPIAATRSLGGAVPFSPSSISGLQLWLKTDTLSGSDGDLLSTWNDQSGNARNATAAGAARPAYKTAVGFAINGRAIVSAGGTSGVKMDLASTISLSGAFTCYAVGRRATSEYFLPIAAAGGNATPVIWNDNNVYIADDPGASPAVAYTGSTGIILARWQRASVGTAPNFAATGMSQAVFGVAVGTLTIGRILARNAAEVTNQGFGEILLWTADLTSGQRTQVETYLAGRWGTGALT